MVERRNVCHERRNHLEYCYEAEGGVMKEEEIKQYVQNLRDMLIEEYPEQQVLERLREINNKLCHIGLTILYVKEHKDFGIFTDEE